MVGYGKQARERARVAAGRGMAPVSTRKKPIDCPEVLIDSGAFTVLDKHGKYPEPVEAYADRLFRLCLLGAAEPAVACKLVH